MTKDDLRRCASMLREIADQIEGGRWGSVNVSVENDHRDKPRTWHGGGQYRGVDIVGKTVRVSLALPSGDT